MARYSRVRGPAADFELAVASARVTGMVIDRLWDDGELLVLYSSRVANVTAAAARLFVQIVLDGSVVLGSARSAEVVVNGEATLTGALLLPVAAGRHVIELFGSGVAAVGDVVQVNATSFVVIQLPLWDDPANLVDL